MEGNPFRCVDGISLGGFLDDLHYVDGLEFFLIIEDFPTTPFSNTCMQFPYQFLFCTTGL